MASRASVWRRQSAPAFGGPFHLWTIFEIPSDHFHLLSTSRLSALPPRAEVAVLKHASRDNSKHFHTSHQKGNACNELINTVASSLYPCLPASPQSSSRQKFQISKNHGFSPSSRGALCTVAAAAGLAVDGQYCQKRRRGAAEYGMGATTARYAPDGAGGADASLAG